MEDPWDTGVAPSWLGNTSQEDPLVAYYREKYNQAEDEIKRLKRQVEFLQESVQRAQHQHELDYQLWLLRDQSEDQRKKQGTPPCGGGQGKGYVAVAEKITGNYQRIRPWARKVKTTLQSPTTPSTSKEESSDDPELEATLLRLLEEGNKH
jgi:hypothetical protein